MIARRKLTETAAAWDAAPYDAPFERTGRPYAEDLAAHYNSRMTRRDIEWAVGQNGELYLRDNPEWSARRTADLERRAEAERDWWKRAQPRDDPHA